MLLANEAKAGKHEAQAMVAVSVASPPTLSKKRVSAVIGFKIISSTSLKNGRSRPCVCPGLKNLALQGGMF